MSPSPPEVTAPEVTTPDQAPVAPSPAEEALPPEADQIFVQQFQILGSTVFSQQDLAEAALTAVGLDPREILTSPGSRVLATRGLTLAELVQAADAITQLYLDAGYISSGAYLDQTSVESGSPVVQIIEGQLEAIAVTLAVPQQTIAIQAIPESLRSPQPIPWEQSLGGLNDAGIILDDADLQAVDLTAIGADSRADLLGDPTNLTLAVAQQVVAAPYSVLNPDSTARQSIPLPERTTPASLRFDPATEAWQAEYAPHLGTRWLEFTGIHPLDPGYISSRLALAGEAPLNINRLVEGVQLLQLDPIIDQIATEIIEGSGLGTSRLNVRATQADTDQFQFSYDNSRSPSVGSIRQGARFSQGNLLGLGDRFQLSAGRSQGSEDWDVLYTLPLSPYNTTLTFNVGASSGEILDTLFSSLDILSSTRYTDITLRQPLYQTPTDEFALSLGLSHTEAQSTFLGGLGFPTAGADSDGFLRITALRFGQDWVRREANQVIALQSTFSLGLDTFGATVNDEPPDTRFQSWQGNAQWARLLAPDLLLLVRGSLQFADRELPPTEQISIGGVSTVRGYRQNTLLTDNGWTASAELQIPVLRIPEIDGLLQIAPFFDAGGGSFSPFRSSTTTLDADTIASIGLGIIWKQSDYLNARLDWGYRLSPITYETNTLQESGIHFSIIFTPSF
ncbi:MAG: ShlB/FhaC/HecB family hemolysin secretion/activation protein [Leptolyngbya sp. RL_3_1]|nr:ShlB/FhaC/HecB family hemolysin secretion/activation protein [Leptolyngbya sp. RL_3_1]